MTCARQCVPADRIEAGRSQEGENGVTPTSVEEWLAAIERIFANHNEIVIAPQR